MRGSGGGGGGMARSTLSSRFRRLDIDQYDENRFVEEPDEAAAAAETDAGPEVEALLRQYPLGAGREGGEGARAAAATLGPAAHPPPAEPRAPRPSPVTERSQPDPGRPGRGKRPAKRFAPRPSAAGRQPAPGKGKVSVGVTKREIRRR